VRLAARGLTAADVVNALEEQNVEVPAGQLGQPPTDSKQSYQIPVRVVGRLTSPEEFDNIIVKNSPNGLVQLKDVGRAVIGAEGYSTGLKYAGHDAMGLGVEQLSQTPSKLTARPKLLSNNSQRTSRPASGTQSHSTPRRSWANRFAKCLSPWPRPL
jgi:Cu/Ag efflux pump CusA